MVDAEGRLLGPAEDLPNARLLFQELARLFFKRAIIEVNVGDLVIGHGEHFACATIEHVPPQLILDGEPPFVPEKTVEMDWPVNVTDTVLGDDQDLNGLLRKKVEQIAHDLVYGLQVSRNRGVTGAEPLKVIIEVRQIDQAQSRVMLCFNPFG